MSHSASADDGIESDSHSQEVEDHDLDEGVQQVRENVTKRLKKVDDHGEQIKQIVGHAIVGDRTDSDVSGDLQREIMEHISEIHSSNDAVTINEIAIALWGELYRVSEMVTADAEEEAGAGEPDGSDETAVAGDSEADPQGTLAFADGGTASKDDTENGESPTETDPAFQ